MFKKGNPYRFKKGNSVSGRPARTKEQRELEKLTRTRLRCAINEYLAMTPSELTSVHNNKKTIMLDKIVAKLIQSTHKKADQRMLDWLAKQIF